MKGYTIQHSIELLERQAGSGSGGASTASEVSFDNTGTGLVATNVQSALAEVSARDNYSTDEIAIGKVGDDILYRKYVVTGALPNATNKKVAHNISNLKMLYSVSGVAKDTSSNAYVPLPMTLSYQTLAAALLVVVDNTDIALDTGTDLSGFNESVVVLEYTKTASEAKTTRKKKQEEN